MDPRAAEALREQVYDGAAYRPFGEMTATDADGRAAELAGAAGFGPTTRVRPVARAWDELAALLRERKAGTVSELDAETVVDFAERLWVIPKQGSLMQDPTDPGQAQDSGS